MIELTLEDLAYGGSAVGRYEGRAIFVAGGLPNERVQVEIIADKGRFAVARLLAVLESSPQRITPRCRHFGACGGCHWQHMAYPAQLNAKTQIVRDQFARIAKLPDAPILDILPSPNPWHYRSHATLHHADDGRIGFVSVDDREITPIQECHIIAPELAEQLPQLPHGEPRERVRLYQDHYTVKGRVFHVGPESFFQVNVDGAEMLIDLALRGLALTGTEQVLDLYCGVGLFTAFIAPHAHHVIALELSPSAVRDARRNLAEFHTVEIVQGAAEKALPRLHRSFDAAIVDPPRAGLKPAALEALIKGKPRRLVYVSCDPATLARDSRHLIDCGYRLVEVQPVDMFPQTYHIECVAAFVWGKAGAD